MQSDSPVGRTGGGLGWGLRGAGTDCVLSRYWGLEPSGWREKVSGLLSACDGAMQMDPLGSLEQWFRTWHAEVD